MTAHRGRYVVAALMALLLVGLVSGVATGIDPAHAAGPRRFWTSDRTHYLSPWFAGRHRIMVPFGCTRAPYYPHDPRCAGTQGFHHGIDVAMRCGNPIYARVRGRVVDPTSAGALGPAYGGKAFRVRHHGQDIVFGHVRRVYVAPGDRVHRGQLIARAGQLGAPDGCHLHFEVRPAGGGYTTAVNPRGLLHLVRPNTSSSA